MASHEDFTPVEYDSNGGKKTAVSSQSSSFLKVGSSSSSREGSTSTPPNPSFAPTLSRREQALERRNRRPRAPRPAIPDMRTEAAYMASIRGAENHPWQIFAFTVWGQVMNPFVQGFAWGIGAVMFSWYRREVLESGKAKEWGRQIRQFFKTGLGFST